MGLVYIGLFTSGKYILTFKDKHKIYLYWIDTIWHAVKVYFPFYVSNNVVTKPFHFIYLQYI